jgi:nucleoid DNA-binding protein|nr:MAG TPA: Bacterial DNA-binding protein [Caudoviricetes sp.]
MARTKPRLTYREIETQIFKRSGIPVEFIRMTMNLWAEIAEEGLLGGMEVPVGNFGFITWKQKPPKENVALWNMQKKCYGEPQDIPGYCKANFRFGSNWKQKLKNASMYEKGQPNPMAFGLEEEYQDDEDNENEIEENEDGE